MEKEIKIEQLKKIGKPLSLRNGSIVGLNYKADKMINRMQRKDRIRISNESQLNFIRLTCFRIIKSNNAFASVKSFAKRSLDRAELAYIDNRWISLLRIYYAVKKFTLTKAARALR